MTKSSELSQVASKADPELSDEQSGAKAESELSDKQLEAVSGGRNPSPRSKPRTSAPPAAQ